MPEIELPFLAISLLPILLVGWLSQRWSRDGWETAYATGRMVIQLLAVGFALVFIFESKQPLVGAGIVFLMIGVSSFIAIRKVKDNRMAALRKSLLAVGAGGGVVFLFVVFAVLQVSDPWYQPRILIPIAGMIFSNSMTAITLAAERFDRERTNGASFAQARGEAWSTALIPQINALLAVGLVALPGMMTGQILSGVDPLVAVRYQIVVMAMVLESAAFSVAIYLQLSKPAGP